MSGSGRLQSDPLFQGLTRPTMIMGVSYMYFVVNGIVSLICFINLQNWFVIPVAMVVHLIGYLICLKEPRAIELFMVKVAKGYKCTNRGYHGYTNSYDPF